MFYRIHFARAGFFIGTNGSDVCSANRWAAASSFGAEDTSAVGLAALVYQPAVRRVGTEDPAEDPAPFADCIGELDRPFR